MEEIRPEYALLFNGITDVICQLQELQKQAEKLFAEQGASVVLFPQIE